MKKTLALALVAAMTISMASMTAFAKNVKYSDETDKWPEKSVATVTLKKEDCTETKIPIYKATKTVSITPASYTTGAEIPEDVYDKLGSDLKAGFRKTDETKSIYTIKFGDLKLKTFSNTATKTFFGWVQSATNDETKSAAQWATDSDPTEKKNVLKDDKEITVTLATDGTATLYFLTVGRTDTTDEAIAKNLENIEKAKKDKEEAEANKKDLEKWDEEHNATNNVVKPDDDGKTVVGTAEAFVTYMGGKWDNKDAQYYGNDDYCRHAAQVIGLGEGPGDMYDIYSVEAPAGFLKGKSARITLTPNVMKNPSDFDITVYHVEGWCKAKKVKDFKIVDNKIVLWGDSFSPYVVVYNTKGASSTGSDASNPSTGDFSAVPVALLAAAALGATGFVAYKKRKAE